MQIQIQIEILFQKISQIEIKIHQKKVFENTFQIQILFKYTSLALGRKLKKLSSD